MSPVYGFRCYGLVVGHDPADLMFVTVTPQQPADFPDIRVRTAMWAGLDREAATQRKWHNIAGGR